MAKPEHFLTTERLILRRWCEADLDPLCTMGQDPEVMRYLGGVMSREESAKMLRRLNEIDDQDGMTFWAAERRDTGALIGFIGLVVMRYEAHYTPCVEIGWRLLQGAWGHGFASEGARTCLEWGFTQKGLEEIYAATTPENIRSLKVMERIGMYYVEGGDFDDPLVPEDAPYRRLVLYRARRESW